jgi:hypothetical protein
VNSGIYLAEGDLGAALLTMPVAGKVKTLFKVVQSAGDAIEGSEPDMVVVEDGTTGKQFALSWSLRSLSWRVGEKPGPPR